MAKKAAIYPIALLAVHIFANILQAESPVYFKNNFDSKLEADFSNGDATPLKIKNAFLVEGRTGKGVNLPSGSAFVYKKDEESSLDS